MKHEIKILHTIYALSGGGAERQLQILLKYSPDDAVHAVLCVNPSDVNLKSLNITLYNHQRQKKNDWRLYYSCYNAIKQFNPDVVHVWLPPVISIPSLLIAKFLGKRTVFSYRNTMHFRRLLDIFEYCMVFLCAKKIITNNSYHQSAWQYRMLYKIKRGCMIPNGIDFSLLSRKDNFLLDEDRPIRLIFIGRLVEQKNILNLIRALVLLPKRYNWRLDVYGEGPQRMVASQLAEELGIKNILFHGFEKNIFPKIAESDLLIMPSVHEGMPNVLIEAMATPIPIVASEITAVTNIVGNSEAIILVDPYDPKSIAHGISKYLSNPHYYTNKLKIGIDIALRYGAEKMTRRYHEEYRQLIKR